VWTRPLFECRVVKLGRQRLLIFVFLILKLNLFIFYFLELYLSRRKFFSAFIPSRLVLSPGGRLGAVGSRLWSARGPTSVVVVTGQMTIFCMFLVGGWRNPISRAHHQRYRLIHSCLPWPASIWPALPLLSLVRDCRTRNWFQKLEPETGSTVEYTQTTSWCV